MAPDRDRTISDACDGDVRIPGSIERAAGELLDRGMHELGGVPDAWRPLAVRA